jgi:hypothetical protein
MGGDAGETATLMIVLFSALPGFIKTQLNRAARLMSSFFMEYNLSLKSYSR